MNDLYPVISLPCDDTSTLLSNVCSQLPTFVHKHLRAERMKAPTIRFLENNGVQRFGWIYPDERFHAKDGQSEQSQGEPSDDDSALVVKALTNVTLGADEKQYWNKGEYPLGAFVYAFKEDGRSQNVTFKLKKPTEQEQEALKQKRAKSTKPRGGLRRQSSSVADMSPDKLPMIGMGSFRETAEGTAAELLSSSPDPKQTPTRVKADANAQASSIASTPQQVGRHQAITHEVCNLTVTQNVVDGATITWIDGVKTGLTRAYVHGDRVVIIEH